MSSGTSVFRADPSTAVKPYSLSERPFFKAIPRNATLCSFDPLKYCSANGNCLFDTARKSH